MSRVVFYTHSEPTPDDSTCLHPHRAAAIEHLAQYGGYCTVKEGEVSITKKANGSDLGLMVAMMAETVQAMASKSYRRSLSPATPPQKDRTETLQEDPAYRFGYRPRKK